MLVSPPPPPASITTAFNEENLPMRIFPNPRKKITPEMVRLGSKRHECPSPPLPLIRSSDNRPQPRIPLPKHDHSILWFPKTMCFKFQGGEIKQTLKIMNRSKKIMNIKYMGIWDGNAKMGASWCIRPKTRMVVAPGLSGIIQVRAVPREHGVLAYATAGIQLATNFDVDLVVGYFVVPVFVEFELSFTPSTLVEEEERSLSKDNLDLQIPEKPATLSS